MSEENSQRNSQGNSQKDEKVGENYVADKRMFKTKRGTQSWKEKFENLKMLYDALPPEVKYWHEKLGQLVRVTRRDYNDYVGQLLAVYYEPVYIEVGTVTRAQIDYMKKIERVETKAIRTDFKSLVQVDFIFDITEEKKKEEVTEPVITT